MYLRVLWVGCNGLGEDLEGLLGLPLPRVVVLVELVVGTQTTEPLRTEHHAQKTLEHRAARVDGQSFPEVILSKLEFLLSVVDRA